jgi:hypothetical protein
MRTEFQPATFTSIAPNAGRPAGARAEAAVAFAFEERVAAVSATTGEASVSAALLSVTENATWSERLALNLSSLSDSPSSVARAIRESYGRSLSARPRRFHAHA